MTRPPPPGWLIWPDLEITRCKRYHMVMNPDRKIVFRSRVLRECVAYLDAEDVAAYRLHWGHPDYVTLACRVETELE